MAIKKIQIGFRVNKSFHKRIEAESIKRDLSVQDLVTYALQYYFTTPAECEYAGRIAEIKSGRRGEVPF